MNLQSSMLLLFTKPARPGRVKTRLVDDGDGPLTAEQAARLHAAFVADLVERLRPEPFRLCMAWDLGGNEGLQEAPPSSIADLDLKGLPTLRQRGSNLGARLCHAFVDVSDQAEYLVALGSDHPTMRAELLNRAFELLSGGAPVVLGPADDGGYYLIGVRADTVDRRLFEDISWSTSSVFDTTVERCRELGYRPAFLPRGYDVDRPDDLRRLAAELEIEPTLCPRTYRLLAGWQMISVGLGSHSVSTATATRANQGEVQAELEPGAAPGITADALHSPDVANVLGSEGSGEGSGEFQVEGTVR